ncbi:ThuA domain-containing protein [Asticcacaulis machinosus]|uniref:ThuA domain-containing protein n=1 Tax=Asticcacaulis machinosus TaxID=2984211 RepID=A0ABT5HI65_9CAUL|nr:ThuA domain-containing protein [Asticcacaulis machinosus]MDC7675934.1 ThuA domain-containing protein [Asticcacaulis machinosus]
MPKSLPIPRPLTRREWLLGGAALFASGVPAYASGRRIRVLLLDGFNNHDWQQTTRIVQTILAPTGLFEVTVSTAPPSPTTPGWADWRPRFQDFDVVIQTCNDYKSDAGWPDVVKADFEAYVRKGGGVYVLHAANNGFPDWPEYNDMIGLGWRPKNYGIAVHIDGNGKIARIPAGQGDKSSHGPRANALVHRLNDHPVHQGLPRQWMTADLEHYSYVRGPAKNLTILTYAYEAKTQMNWPLEWVVRYGQGRVYVANYGHVWTGDVQPLTLRSADVQTILPRALQWLARRPVTFPVPSDFPTATKTSVRPEFEGIH